MKNSNVQTHGRASKEEKKEKKMVTYLDPKADLTFKKVFGEHKRLVKSLLNAAKAYVRQSEQGKGYKLLQPVYSLNLVNDVFEPDTEEYYHHYKLVNIKNTDKVIEGLQLVFVELPKFKPDGRAEGRAEGRTEGLQEGLEKGRAEGKAEGLKEAAAKMKQLGIPAEQIAQSTGMTVEEIRFTESAFQT